MNLLAAFVAGALFAIGLVLGDMTEPARIIHFLDVAGDWDPLLAFVMAGAVSVYALLYPAITRLRNAPLLAERFELPRPGPLDRKLILGAAMFGVGWGLSGLCPGPALVALGAGKLEAALFVAAMVAGSYAASWFGKLGQPHKSRPTTLLADDA